MKSNDNTTVLQVCPNLGDDDTLDGAIRSVIGVGGGRGCRESTGARSPLGGIPITKPPYAHLVAIDLNKGDIAWKVPFGDGSDRIRNHPLLAGVELPDRLGTFGHIGSIVTKGGLVFIGGGDPYLYAFDKAAGDEIWRGATPSGTSGTPMSYQARSGRQFVLIPSGGGIDASLVAFALPE